MFVSVYLYIIAVPPMLLLLSAKSKSLRHKTHPLLQSPPHFLPLLSILLSQNQNRKNQSNKERKSLSCFSLLSGNWVSLCFGSLGVREKMGEKDEGFGLGLSLSLGCKPTENESSLQLNLTGKASQLMQNHHQKPSFNENCQFADRDPETRSFLRGIDVNQAAEFEEENGVSSPNSTVSSLSGKRSEREPIGDENEGERTSCSRGSDDEDGNGGDMSRKKLRLTKEQSLMLEETFKEHHTLNPRQKQALAKQLNLRPRQVEVWFQNRRARTKLKQTEVDCELLKRCCEKLTEDNRRLQKEVQELRALKLSPQLYMHMTPPTTLTMCPSCERVAVSSSSSAAAATVSSTAPANAPNRQNGRPDVLQPVPISPWATLPIQHRPRDASAPRS